MNSSNEAYILVVEGNIVITRHGLYWRTAVCGQVVLGGGGVLVGDHAVRHREKLLHLAPPLLRCMYVVAHPHNQPGKEVCSHTTETTACVCVWCVVIQLPADAHTSSHVKETHALATMV